MTNIQKDILAIIKSFTKPVRLSFMERETKYLKSDLIKTLNFLMENKHIKQVATEQGLGYELVK